MCCCAEGVLLCCCERKIIQGPLPPHPHHHHNTTTSTTTPGIAGRVSSMASQTKRRARTDAAYRVSQIHQSLKLAGCWCTGTHGQPQGAAGGTRKGTGTGCQAGRAATVTPSGDVWCRWVRHRSGITRCMHLVALSYFYFFCVVTTANVTTQYTSQYPC